MSVEVSVQRNLAQISNLSVSNLDADLQSTFAQISQTEGGNNCQTTQDRLKAPLDDFATIYAGTEKYTDSSFGPNLNSLFWSDLDQTWNRDDTNTTWVRTSEKYADHTLYGPDGVHPNDVQQGQLGDCWFLSAAAAVAQIPGVVEKMFLNNANENSANGIYAVNFFSLGVQNTVLIDDYLPSNSNGNPLFAKVNSRAVAGEQGSLWVPLMEKAFAKYHGNYLNIVGGDPADSLRTMNNSPLEYYGHKDRDVDEAWAYITSHIDRGQIVQVATPGTAPEEDFGLVNGHAYNTLGHVTLSTGQRLIKVQNPWGVEMYKGAWSDDSELWTDELRAEINFTNSRNDGFFWMAFEDYMKFFSTSYTQWDTTNWFSDHFLKLGDDSAAENPGVYNWCGAECTHHKLTLTSSVAQTVHVTGHTWGKRCTASQCDVANMHTIGVQGHGLHGWNFGGRDVPEFSMEAGESLVVDIEMNFTDPSKAKDWSVVAWGELGEVSVTMEGHTSDVMPVVGAENDGGNDGDDGADDGDDGADDGDDGADDGEDDDEEPVSYLSQTDINRFTNKVNNIKLWQWADHDCGSKIKKNISKTTEAGVPVKWNLAKHTCDHVNLEVTYYLPTEEWDSMLPENYYGGVTDAGLVGCNVDPNDATQTGCKYIVAANEKIGFISQAAVTKLTKKWVSI